MAGNNTEQPPRGPPPTGLPDREKLPKSLQSIVDKADKDESFYDDLYDGTYVQTPQKPTKFATVINMLLDFPIRQKPTFDMQPTQHALEPPYYQRRDT
jgi:hypothetical protein